MPDEEDAAVLLRKTLKKADGHGSAGSSSRRRLYARPRTDVPQEPG